MAPKPIMTAEWLIVIGGSAGSLDVLLQLLPSWHPDKHAAILIVLHRKAEAMSQLTELLNAKTGWTVQEARDKQPIMPGNIYIAPPDYHLLVESDHSCSLDYSEKINFSRPCIDATFETAGHAYGNRLICLLLSGANTDGTLGLQVARRFGAHIIIQDPATAITPYMPQHAINEMVPDAVLAPLDMIAYIGRCLQD